MALKQVLETVELLDRPAVAGSDVAQLFATRGFADVEVASVEGEQGATSFVKLRIPGRRGKAAGGTAPTLGVLGILGGVGARPEVVGLVSDADGAVAAVATGLKLVDMYRAGDRLVGDVIVGTHVCADAPVVPHDPVPFMGSPVSMSVKLERLVDPEMDALLSVDTTKGTGSSITAALRFPPWSKRGTSCG